MNNSLELLTYNARTKRMKGWLISNAYVGIKRSSEQWEAGAFDFQASRRRLFYPRMNPISTLLPLLPPSRRKLSLSSHLLEQRRPMGRRLLSTSSANVSRLSRVSVISSNSLALLANPRSNFLYVRANNFCRLRELSSMNINCLLGVLVPLKTFRCFSIIGKAVDKFVHKFSTANRNYSNFWSFCFYRFEKMEHFQIRPLKKIKQKWRISKWSLLENLIIYMKPVVDLLKESFL